MKGPSGHSVVEATRTLLRSIHEENREIREDTLDRPDVGSRQRFLDDANSNLDSLELTLQAVRDEIGSRLVAARRHRNNVLPIFRLPPKLLLNIFHVTLETHLTCGITEPPYLDRLKALASVCSTWLALVRSTPSLWAVLESSCSLSFLPTVIRNSKSSLLNIRSEWEAREYSYRMNEDKEHHRKFLQAVIDPGLTERWSSVYIDLPPDTGLIKELMETSSPNLRRVHFGQAQGWWEQGPVNLLGGNTGRLEELRIKGIPVQWDTVKLTGLRLLDLQWAAPTSSAKLLNLLASSPSLESLKLTGLPIPSNSEQGSLDTISLPRLRELILVDNEAESVIPLLRSIRPSTLDRFGMIHTQYEKGYEEDFVSALDTLGHLIPALQSTLVFATHLELAVGGGNIKFVVYRETEVCFEINLAKTQSSKVFKWISEVVAPDFKERWLWGTHLTFNRDWGSDNNRMAFLPVMEWLGDITGLTLNDPYVSTEVLKWLSERVITENGVEWRCSRLGNLSILCPLVKLSDIRKFAESRYGGSNGNGPLTEGDLTIYWPVNLECLDISGLSGNDDKDAGKLELYDLLGCHEVIGYNRRRRARQVDDYGYYY
ncbi:hypothetical protein FRC04_008211 [Tulasnella sp. 424]|nr:hypothetical protein FRC04_008211 [Tulasnella sp. 424]KAG8974488.1 hypothetical protein FRC05_007287 [Tulasnella sp. 425]